MDDLLLIENIKKQLLKYDYMDIMVKISLLNTMANNQGINSLIAFLVNSLIPEKNEEFLPKISLSHFKDVVRNINKLSFARYIDPVENLFYDIVSIDKQYFSYENIGSHPSYCLNHLLNAVRVLSTNNNMSEFVTKAINMSKYLLQLQTNIITLSGEQNPIKRVFRDNICFYDSVYYNSIKKSVIIDYNQTYESTAGEIEHLIIRNIDNNESNKKAGIYSFFSKPFLKIKESIIVLDPTFLTIACSHYIIMLAQRYGLKGQLIQLYRKSIAEEIRVSLLKIDNPFKVYFLHSSNKQINYLVEELYIGRIILHIIVSDNEDSYFDDSLLSISDNDYLIIDKFISNTITDLKNKYTDININISVVTFGRLFSVGLNKKIPCIMLTPYELVVISKHTRITNCILYYFIKDKFIDNKLNTRFINSGYGDFRYFIVYDEHACSFYMDDSVQLKNMILNIGFDVIYDYIYKTFSPKNNNVIRINNGYLKIENIENNIYLGYIDRKPNFVVKGEEEYFCAIQLKDTKDNKMAYEMADFLSYWLSEAINYICFNGHNCYINISYEMENTKRNIKKNKDEVFDLTFGFNDYLILGKNNYDNSSEKSFINWFINAIEWNIKEDDINKLFGDKLKKKIYSIDCQSQEFMIPLENYDFPIPIASKSKLSFLLDDIGEYFIKNDLYKVNDVISGEERHKLCNKIVEYVYNEFERVIESYDFKSVINIAYASLEMLIPETIIRNDNYKNNIRLYPKKKKEIKEVISEYNSCSVSLRFILEYVAAIQSEGKKKCDLIDLEQLLAYVKTILDWSILSDLFMYDLIDDDINVLGSKRFGYDKESIDRINYLLSSTRFDYLSRVRSNKSLRISMKEKNEIFVNDYGYSFEQYISILGLLYDYGENSSKNVKSISKENWMSLCEEKGVSNNLRLIIDDISIEKRSNYFVYKNYSKKEFYPWRFNRLFSLFRRPLIKIGNNYFWGNRNLNHNIHYISNLMNQGLFNSGKKNDNYSLKFSGVIAEQRGELFNTYIYDIFNTFPDMKTYRNVVSVNSKHISDENGNDLGDIDVLSISEKMRKIFIVEAKDYSLARNLIDLSKEIKKVFYGDTNNKSDYDKHMIRFKWVLNHKEDIIKEYKLKSANWTFVPLFVTNQPLVSAKIYSESKYRVVDCEELDYSFLKKVK